MPCHLPVKCITQAPPPPDPSPLRTIWPAPSMVPSHLVGFAADRRAERDPCVHADFRAFLAGPVPMRQQVEHGIGRPPRLVIIEIVLRETAHVEDAEMRIDARPRIRRRLAAIIKTRPDETAAQPRPVGEKSSTISPWWWPSSAHCRRRR